MSCRILVLDDEPLILRLWSKLFRLLGCSVIAHSSGHEALEDLRREPFDIVVTDLRMPEMSGYDFLDALRREPLPYTPKVFVCSGYVAPDADFDELCVTRVIPKPFNIDAEVVYFRNLIAVIEEDGLTSS